MASATSSSFLLFLTCISAVCAIAKGVPEETIHMRLYALNLTMATVASLHRNDPISSFGNITVLDAALTEQPELSSEPVGRIQSLGVGDNLKDKGLLTNLNVVFSSGKYNGSSLAVIGGSDSPVVGSADRSIVGGGGQFHLARGYVLSELVQFEPFFVLGFDFYVMPCREL